MQKRGLSEVVGWVLLIGISVMMGTVVMQWMKDHTEETAHDLAEDTEQTYLCDETAFDVTFITTNCDTLHVVNKGYHTLSALKAKSSIGIDDTFTFSPALLPGQTQTLNSNGHTSLQFTPVLLSQGKEIVCPLKKIKASCTP